MGRVLRLRSLREISSHKAGQSGKDMEQGAEGKRTTRRLFPRDQLARLSPEIPVVLTAWFCATVLELLHRLVQKLIEQDEECAWCPEELAQVKRSLDTPDDTWVTPAPIFCSEPAPAEPGAVCPA